MPIKCTNIKRYGLMTRMQYGNDHVVKYTYNQLERPAAVVYNDDIKFTYAFTYDMDGLRLTKKLGRAEHKYIR